MSTLVRPTRLGAPMLTALLVRSVMRVALLTLCFALAAIRGADASTYYWLLAFIGSSLLAAAPWTVGWPRRVLRYAEAVAIGVGVLATGGESSPLLPLVVVPAFGAGIDEGVPDSIIATGLAAAALLGGRALGVDVANPRDFVATAAQWVVIALAVGLIAAWVRYMLEHEQVASTDDTYAEAHQLLEQLRAVTRQLPVGLDPVTTGDRLLSALAEVRAYDVGAVFVRSGGSRLVPLATRGARTVDWPVDVGGDNPFAEAWAGQQPQVRPGGLTPGARRGSGLVVPLTMGRRTFGLIGLESEDAGGFPREVVERMLQVARDIALRLDSALLFEEIRNVATTDERQRLAREIHDGIAQELVYLGYAVDNARYDARDGRPIDDQLSSLRDEMTRIISELRLSIFDLRSDVISHGGLGTALADYVRAVGRGSSFAVHLTLDESASRLPVEVEEEVLRIGQEAINNVRKHAQAENLWVSLQVDPPNAVLRVEDDGIGIPQERRRESYGTMIMQERADRLRAHLSITARDPRGTVVEVRLGRTAGADGGDVRHDGVGDVVGTSAGMED